ncbi:hypothetical protein L3X38_000220 (mitochondrion) [Prunus dulcis]|uniref:Uncharacterized protein n=1 Tax=Prunus dulcis TaxID=3755 RepID=A0AAD4USW3_PRUDU|nr:hypothetical protein L3X38_000220 [Prunus dulcis]
MLLWTDGDPIPRALDGHQSHRGVASTYQEYKLGRTNQVADALSRKTELAAFKSEAVAATSRVTSTLPHRIRDGLGTREKPFAPS